MDIYTEDGTYNQQLETYTIKGVQEIVFDRVGGLHGKIPQEDNTMIHHITNRFKMSI